ncbi:MAG: hypothetical protein AAF413_02510 [Patescibacteria group bacterium]
MRSSKKTDNIIIEAIGWLGVVMIIGAYALSIFELIAISDRSYIGMNIAGSLGLIASSLHKKDMQPVALNIVWLIIALVAIMRSYDITLVF